MARISFSQVLKNAKIDILREYVRLFDMFYTKEHQIISLRECCEAQFSRFPFKDTCVSLDDFDDFYGYSFEQTPANFSLDYLVDFCEYSYNLAANTHYFECASGLFGMEKPLLSYIQQVHRVIEKIGYMENEHDGIIDFVPKDAVAISVAEIIDPSLSYRVIEYNHHSMKGDIDRKKAVLLALADKLEPQRKRLNKADQNLESDLFCLLNSMNIRHNNTEQGSKNYKVAVAAMKGDELEQWYDEIYQMCLLSFLTLENEERKDQVKALKQKLN